GKESRLQLVHYISDVEAACGNRVRERRQASWMVNRTERFRSALALWNDGPAVCSRGLRQEYTERLRRQGGHIASGDQAPFGIRYGERRQDTADRAAARETVRENAIAERTVKTGISYEGGAAAGLRHDSGGVLGERPSVPGKQGFVAAHPGALAAYQHKPGVPHGGMVALHLDQLLMFGWRALAMAICTARDSRYNRTNKRMRVCFQATVAAARFIILG